MTPRISLTGSNISYKLKYLSLNELTKIKNHFQSNKLPIIEKKMYNKKIFKIIQKDKKNTDGKVNLVLLKKIGRAFLNNKNSIEKIKNASKNDLLSIKGVPKTIINKLYDFFNSQ